MKKILVITTGGTIAMKKDRETGGLMPAVSGKDLAAAVPGLAHYADVDVLEFSKRETHRHSRWFFLCGPRAYLTSGASTRLRPVHLHPTSCYP